MGERYVAADPCPWPYDGDLRPANTALLVIDMQTDFCGPGGYVDKMGYDLQLTRAPIEPIRRVLATLPRLRGVSNLLLSGITTDVCVHTTMPEANDRGFECLLLADCCGATDRSNHMHALKMVKTQGGVFGAVATSAAFLAALCGQI
jgi:nicotinamidase-related amidase